MHSKLKIHFLLFILTMGGPFGSFCQTPGYRKDTKFPTFDLNFLIIRASHKPINKFEFLNTEISSFLAEFPDPDKNEDFYFEMDEQMARLISYCESEFYFLDGKLSDFRLQDSKFSIGNGKNFIKVGDHYSSIEHLFPIYEIEIQDEFQTKSPHGIIWIVLSNKEVLLDEALIILFDAKTEKITEINF